MSSLRDSYAYCRDVTTRSGSSFHFAFGLLPRPQRDAMYALYAFFRLTDDLSDGLAATRSGARIPEEHAPLRVAANQESWRQQLTLAFQSVYSHPCHAALYDAVQRYNIPQQYLYDVIDGCESDLQPSHYPSFDQLKPYLYRVASVVGLCCLRVWGLRPGCQWEDAESLAIEAGYAFQLTNILRDLREDATVGRCYLPADELTQFGVVREEFLQPEFARTPQFKALVKFQIERAKAYYNASYRLAKMLPRPGRAMYRLMHRSYAGLLDRIESQSETILTRRVTVPKWWKAFWLLRAWIPV